MIIKIKSDKERSKSIINLLKEREELIKTLNNSLFPTTMLENYYEIIKELITAIMYADGFKTIGEGSHKETIDYLKNYKEFSEYEINILNELRIKRHGSQYYGKKPNPEFVKQNEQEFKEIIKKLKDLINKKLQETFK